MYRLDPLFRPLPSNDPISEALLQEDPPRLLDFADVQKAEIEGVIFLSVPVSTTVQSAERLREMVSVSLADKKPVVVLTHNIELLRARKLRSSEAGKILGNIQDPGEAATTLDTAALVERELRKAVYDRVRNVLDSSETIEPERAGEVLDSLRTLIQKVESTYADQDSDTPADAPDHRH